MADVDVTEVSDLARDINRDAAKRQRRLEAALSDGIDVVYVRAIADAEQMRDTGDMVAATRKVGRGFSRIVRCYDPAGLMNEFGSHGRAPRPWLLVHADAGADAVERGVLRDLDDFLR